MIRKYALIPLTRGLVAAISLADAELVKEYTWQAAATGRFFSATTQIESILISLSRFLLGVQTRDVRWVDHWNGYTLDNRRCNLRVCNRKENRRNSVFETTEGQSSMYRGVCKRGNRFTARIYVEGDRKRLGSFLSERDAAVAYDVAARQFFREFAVLNFPLLHELPPKPPRIIRIQKPKLADPLNKRPVRANSITRGSKVAWITVGGQ